MLPENELLGSISTLPIGWPNNPFSVDDDEGGKRQLAGEHLRQLAGFLNQLEDRTGKRIVVAIEPEPGCDLDTVDDMVSFFEQELSEPIQRKYITVCHDICHSAVMNERQTDVIRRYSSEGITIGKVQVSSAIVANWNKIAAEDRAAALIELSGFAEDRYLHQTGIVTNSGAFSLVSDLPDLLSKTESADLWRQRIDG